MPRLSDQYRIITGSGGWIDHRSRGRIRFDGADALSFLQALLTNDLGGLQPGDGRYAAYLTPQGRMIADLHVYRRQDDLFAEVAPGVAAELASRLDGLIFTEDVRVLDVSSDTTSIGLVGAPAARAAAGVLGVDEARVAQLPPFGHVATDDVVLARTDEARDPSYSIFAPLERHGELVGCLEGQGVEAISADLAEALRIDAGRPLFGQDMTTETIPLEAGLLDRAISTGKGCYVGQEVIIRILHRGAGRVAKRLVRLEFDPSLDQVPPPGTALLADGKQVGHVTSAAHSPRGPTMIGLGYVTRDRADAGGPVSATVGGRSTDVTIAGLAG